MPKHKSVQIEVLALLLILKFHNMKKGSIAQTKSVIAVTAFGRLLVFSLMQSS